MGSQHAAEQFETPVLYNQRDATYTMFFIIISALHVSGGFSARHQELIKLCASLGIVMLSCCLPLVWMGCWNNPSTPAVDSRKA
jgi:hypothetical protein